MAEENTMEKLQEEIKTLRSQLEDMVKAAESKRSEISHEVLEKLTNELESLRRSAGDQAHRIYDAGQAGLDEVSAHVRRSPLTSLAIAFGAGCVISCLIRHLR